MGSDDERYGGDGQLVQEYPAVDPADPFSLSKNNKILT